MHSEKDSQLYSEYLQAQQMAAQQAHHGGPIDLSPGPGSHSGHPTISLEQLSALQNYRGHSGHQEMYPDVSLLGSMLHPSHYHGPPSPGSPINPNTSPAASVYGGHTGSGSGAMSPTKKLSKPLIEKRRRDRINRCLRLLKELVIDSKRFPVANMNKSRFEKADILEITVKYLMMVQQEERRMFQLGFSTCHEQITKLVQELTSETAKDVSDSASGSKDDSEAMIVVQDEEETLEETPSTKPSTSGADLNLVTQLCARLAALGEQIAAEQQLQQQRTASLTNLVLELNELGKSRSASITSEPRSGEVTPTRDRQEQHLQNSPSIEDLLMLDGMRIYEESDEENSPSTQMLKQYFKRQNSSSGSGPSSGGGVIRHTSNYHAHQEGSQKTARSSQWPSSGQGHPPMLVDGPRDHLAAFHHRSGSLSTAKSSSSSASSTSSSSSSSSSASHPSATSFFKPGQATAVDPSLINFTQAPVFTALNMAAGNERNSGAMSSYEAIWRPWGFNA